MMRIANSITCRATKKTVYPCTDCKYFTPITKTCLRITVGTKEGGAVYASADEHRLPHGLCGPDGSLFDPLIRMVVIQPSVRYNTKGMSREICIMPIYVALLVMNFYIVSQLLL